MQKIKHYFRSLIISVDQLFNTLFGGWPDETFSARCWRCKYEWPWRFIRPELDCLFWPIDGKGHCYQAWLNERERRQMPVEYREQHEIKIGV